MRGADGDIVEEAEPHGAVALGMMAGGTYEREAVVDAAGDHRVEQLQHAADRQTRRIERPGRHRRVGVEREVRHRASARHLLEVAWPVHEGDVIGRRQPGLDVHQAGLFQQLGKKYADAFRPLGVPGAGIVLHKPLVEYESCAHPGDTVCRLARYRVESKFDTPCPLL